MRSSIHDRFLGAAGEEGVGRAPMDVLAVTDDRQRQERGSGGWSTGRGGLVNPESCHPFKHSMRDHHGFVVTEGRRCHTYRGPCGRSGTRGRRTRRSAGGPGAGAGRQGGGGACDLAAVRGEGNVGRGPTKSGAWVHLAKRHDSFARCANWLGGGTLSFADNRKGPLKR